MPKRDVAPLGAPCWIDLMTSDPATSKAFYTELFGWTLSDPGPDYGGYVNFLLGDIPIAGCMGKTPEMGPMPDVWSVYLAVADAKSTVDAAAANGGAVLYGAMEVMELGSMGVVSDTGGAAIGLWQPGLHKGFGLLGEPGAPAWFELYTRDYPAAIKFYQEVFGWDTHTMSDTPEFRYTTLGEGDDALAGIMDGSSVLPEGVPSHWGIYLAVADCDATLAKVNGLGGATVMPAEDTPFGRIAQVSDPTGAMFKVVAG